MGIRLIVGAGTAWKGPEHFSAQIGDLVFEIHPRLAFPELSGPARIGFSVASVDEMVAKLRQLGADVLSEPQDSQWGRRAVLNDPDGHRIEISESPASCGPIRRDAKRRRGRSHAERGNES